MVIFLYKYEEVKTPKIALNAEISRFAAVQCSSSSVVGLDLDYTEKNRHVRIIRIKIHLRAEM